MNVGTVIKQLSEFDMMSLLEVKEAIDDRIKKKNEENRVLMYEVIIDGFLFAMLKSDELELALDIMKKNALEEGVYKEAVIRCIKVRESEVEEKRFVW